MIETMLRTVIFGCLLTLSGSVARAEDKILYFPILTHVGDFRSVLKIMNPSEYKVRYKLRATSPVGGTLNVRGTLRPFRGQGVRASGDLNFIRRQGGWGLVRYHFLEAEETDSLNIIGWTELSFGEFGNPISTTNIPAVEAALEFRVPAIWDDKSETAVAILNPSKESVQIDVTLLLWKDREIRNRLSIVPESRLSRFLWELVSEGQEQKPDRPFDTEHHAQLHIRADTPIAVGALHYYHSTGTFAALPVVAVKASQAGQAKIQ